MSKGLEAFKAIAILEMSAMSDDNMSVEQAEELRHIIEKELKALNEILALHDKWLGNEMSDFEFFTLLSETRDKYGLSEEVLS